MTSPPFSHLHILIPLPLVLGFLHLSSLSFLVLYFLPLYLLLSLPLLLVIYSYFPSPFLPLSLATIFGGSSFCFPLICIYFPCPDSFLFLEFTLLFVLFACHVPLSFPLFTVYICHISSSVAPYVLFNLVSSHSSFCSLSLLSFSSFFSLPVSFSIVPVPSFCSSLPSCCPSLCSASTLHQVDLIN